MWNKIIKERLITVFFIFFLSSIFVIDPLLKKGIFQAHDMPSNLTYFGGFYESLKDGNIFPRWAGNIANLYGSPTIMFFYPMSYYLASIIRSAGFSLIDSMKILIFISYSLSAVFFYLWIKSYTSKLGAIAGSLLYVFAPYRITDIYARGSIAEHISFLFLPLVLYFLAKLKNKFQYIYLLLFSLSVSAFLLSHPFMFVIFSPFIILYFIFLGFNLRKKIIISLFFIMGVLLNSFYIIPLLIETKYTHYDMSPFRGSEYSSQFLNFEKLLKPQWNFIDYYGKLEYQTYQVGLVHILLLIFVFILFFIKRKEVLEQDKKTLTIISITTILLGILLTLPTSDFIYKTFSILQKIEYPWRFLGLIIFSISVLVSVLLPLLKSDLQKYSLLLVIILSFVFYLPYSKGHNYIEYPDSHFLYQIQINTDAFATLPIWAAQPDLYNRPKERYEIVSGQGAITTLYRSSTKHIYEINAEEKSRVVDNTFYFPGWNVYVDEKLTNIQFQDPAYRGIITFEVDKGKHLIEVLFENTRLRLFADLITLIIIISYVLIYKYVKKFK